MTSVQLQDVLGILLWTKNGGKQPERVREDLQRSDPVFGDLEMAFSYVGSQSQSRRLTTNSEGDLTCNLATCRHSIREHGPASLAECGVRFLTLFRRNSCAGIIRRRLKQQQACDRL